MNEVRTPGGRAPLTRWQFHRLLLATISVYFAIVTCCLLALFTVGFALMAFSMNLMLMILFGTPMPETAGLSAARPHAHVLAASALGWLGYAAFSAVGVAATRARKGVVISHTVALLVGVPTTIWASKAGGLLAWAAAQILAAWGKGA